MEEKCGQVFRGEEALSWMYGEGGGSSFNYKIDKIWHLQTRDIKNV